MSDFSRDRIDANDEDRLPWLEAVDEEQDGSGPGAGRLIAAVIAGLVAIGLVVGGVFWMRDRSRNGASSEVIAAPKGDYKVKPDAPGGMQVPGTGDVSYGASEGGDVNSTIDLTAVPEAPVTAPAPQIAKAPVAPAKTVALPPSTAAKPKTVEIAAVAVKPAPAVVKPVPSQPKPLQPPTLGGGGQIQLGAFSSEAKANAAWKSLAGRFSFLAPLAQSVTPVKTGGGTLYRLRASGGEAAGLCAKLKVAGETCAVVN